MRLALPLQCLATPRAWLGLGAASLAAAALITCAAGRSEPASDLEARVARLEQLLLRDASASTPADAPPFRGADASLFEAAPPATSPDASAPDAGLSASAVLTSCMASAEGTCQMRMRVRRTERQIGDAGFAWTREEYPASAASTPEGSRCLKEQESLCIRQAQGQQRDALLQAWLDAQLAPDKLDKAFMAKVHRALEKKGQPLPAGALLCSARFCRVEIIDGGAHDRGLHDAYAAIAESDEARSRQTGSQGRGFNGTTYHYVTRNGYRFPD